MPGHSSPSFSSGGLRAVSGPGGARTEGRGLKAEGFGHMFGKVGPIVPAGIEMKFMRDAAGDEHIVQGQSARLESVIVLRAAIEVDFHSREIRDARDGERVVAGPEEAVRVATKKVSRNRYTARAPG